MAMARSATACAGKPDVWVGVLLIIPSFPAAQTGPAFSQISYCHVTGSVTLDLVIWFRARHMEESELSQLCVNWTPASRSSSFCQPGSQHLVFTSSSSSWHRWGRERTKEQWGFPWKQKGIACILLCHPTWHLPGRQANGCPWHCQLPPDLHLFSSRGKKVSVVTQWRGSRYGLC